MATVELTKDNFEEIVVNNNLVIIDFWAPWCGPCKSFAPTFEAVSEKFPGVVFGKVNTEVEQELAASFQIRSIPTLMVFKEQIIIFSESGALPAQALEQIATQAQTLDMDKVRAEIAAEEAAQGGGNA